MRWAGLLLILATATLAGCGTSSSYGCAQSTYDWTTHDEDPIPGIHAASVTVVTLKAGPPKGVSFAVWSDLPNGRSGSGGGQVGGATFKGRHEAGDGRRISFQAQTMDGKNGTVTIEGKTYDLSNGSLFLISTRQSPPAISQVKFDLDQFPGSQEQLLQLAKDKSVVNSFFEEHKGQSAEP